MNATRPDHPHDRNPDDLAGISPGRRFTEALRRAVEEPGVLDELVGVTPAGPPLYGVKGFLLFFRATFNGRGRYLDLVPQGNASPPAFLGP